ncbi:MAG TPA: amino acid-binding protein [Anaeromyxobacter sp.]
MKIRQLSLFLENRSGQLRIPCKVLGDAGIDILTMSLADTQQFGILRLIVKDWEKAKAALEAAGIVVNVTEVLAVDVPDRPGGLASVLESFEKAGLGIEYMYALAAGRERGNFATLVFRLADPERASKLLSEAGVKLLGSQELFARAGA